MNRAEKRRQQKLAKKAAKRPSGQQTLSIQQSINLAVQHHTAGDLPKAESLYQQIIEADPNQPVALHLLGVIAYQMSNYEIAEDLIGNALAIKPDYAEAHSNLGNVLKELGKLEEAEESFYKALAIKPDYAEAHSNLGNVLKNLEKLDEAVASFHKALAINPEYAAAHNNLGLTLQELGKLNEAVASYHKALAIKPDHNEAHNNLGNALKELGKLEEAVASYHNALAVKPDYAVAHSNLGNTLKDLGKLDEAVASYHKALAIKPDYAEAHINLGVALQELGRLDEAVISYHKALAIKPDYAKAHSNLGNALKDLGKLDEAVSSFHKALTIKTNYAEAHINLGAALIALGKLDEAVASYHKALAIKPDYAEAYSNLGNALKELGKLDEAVASYHKALAIKPDYAEAHSNLGGTLITLGKFDEAIASYHKALTIKSDYAEAHSNIVFAEQYLTSVTLKHLEHVHAEWDKQHGVPLQTEWRDHDNVPDPDRTLRIGFVSPDLGRHPVGYFVINLLEHRQNDNVEYICYSDRKPDDLTERLKTLSDEWIDARGISDEALSQRIRSDRIDILIDLAGHTANNRLLVFARKPAPIQVTWAGYVGSTGLAAMDYLIADGRHVPEGVECSYTEKVIRLPDGYVSYQAPYYAPKVGSLPFEKNKFITFCCFNNPAKINELVLSTWAEILNEVPNSRLILKYRSMDVEGNRNRIYDHFGGYGIEKSRLTLEGRSPHSELFARYNDIDIALDTFPYSGGLTTCEALWMGVPVITKPGETFANRHSLSHLTNVGVSEMVANDVQEYVAKSVELANDVYRLTTLRSGLREQMARSALCDGKKFATDFNSQMRHIWKQWCSENKPESVL